jgi:cytochrome c oxidase cbb3-type subunit 3
MFVQNTSFLGSPYFWGTTVIGIILAYIGNAISGLAENERFKLMTEEEKATFLQEKQVPYFKRLYDSAFKKQSDVEEKDILIDHGFDGIMELDNKLPKWWLGLFYFGVVYAIVYLIAYTVTDFAHPDKEYEVEHKEQIASVEQWMKDTPPPTIDNAKYSADNIAEGEQIFKTNCVSCHSEGGKGGIGPNLTDDYWINKPEKTLFKNIFHVVENGSPNNATMQAWGKNGVLTGFDIEKVAAYVYHINQEMPDASGGAAPQGEKAAWEK